MNCGPSFPPQREIQMPEIKKERVRVQAGREGGPRAASKAVATAAPAAAVEQHQPQSMLAVIASAAADPRCDVTKMQALLDMQKGILAEEARLAFIEAKLLLNEKLPTINKDGKIEFKDKGQGKATLKFASFENINHVIKPLLKEFGFDLWFSSEPGVAGMINVVGHMEHRLGFFRITTFPMPHDASGGKSGAQGWSSAFSFGKRVTTIGLLNIQTTAIEDRDLDGNVGNFKRSTDGYVDVDPIRKLSRAQAAELEEVMKDCGVTVRGFCEIYGIKSVAELNDDLFEAAKKRCLDYKAKRGGNG